MMEKGEFQIRCVLILCYVTLHLCWSVLALFSVLLCVIFRIAGYFGFVLNVFVPVTIGINTLCACVI